MTNDQPKPPPEEKVKNSSYNGASKKAPDHSWLGHVAVVFALLTPIVAYFFMCISLVIMLFAFLITSRCSIPKI